MHRYNILIALIVQSIFIFNVVAQEWEATDTLYHVQFNVLDKVTKQPIKSIETNLFCMDDTTWTVPSEYVFNAFSGQANLTLAVGHKYLLEIIPRIVNLDIENKIFEIKGTDESYETAWVDIDLTKRLSPDVYNMTIPDVLMSKKIFGKKLKEVTVTPSRIIFYHKGDTLIYRADAFILPEGSMLDALIAQLPGVTISSSGEIYCGNRKVDNLLLNGQDLFNGNKQLMLENLGAYTVKDIATYEMEGAASKVMGAKLKGDVKYTMDVRLKKQYRSGWILNAEGGYGSHNRFLGKLFGMWFAPTASITVYAGANNLSDAKKPGRYDGAWNTSMMGNGIVDRKQGGMTYLLNGKNASWELKGDVNASHSLTDQIKTSTNRTFRPDIDVTSRTWSRSSMRSISVSTGHEYSNTSNRNISINIKPYFEYYDRRSDMEMLGAEFLGDIAETVTKQDVENIYMAGYESMLSSMIYRNKYKSLSVGHGYKGKLDATSNVSLRGLGFEHNMLRFALSGYGERKTNDRFTQFDVRYSNQSALFNNQYFKEYPDNDLTLQGSAEYWRYIPLHRMEITAKYEFTHNSTTRTSEQYILPAEEIDVEVLPSMMHNLPAMDLPGSYSSHLTDNNHRIGVTFQNSHSFMTPRSYYWLTGSVYLVVSNRTYQFNRLGKNNTIRRLKPLYGYNVTIYRKRINRPKINMSMNINSKYRRTDMADLIDLPQTDPLVKYEGNPDLRDSYTHSISYTIDHEKKHSKHTGNIYGSIIQNAFARSYSLNTLTGLRTYMTHNVSGNWNAGLGYTFFLQFGPSKMMDIETTTAGDYRRNADIIESFKRIVGNISVREDVKYNCNISNSRITVVAGGNWNRYRAINDAGFTPISALTAKCGLSGVANLPKGWSIASDITLYGRRGYDDPLLNTTDLVWNAGVNKSFLKGSLIVSLSAYDLLQQLSNVTYTINAQARTETVSNVIPSYLLLHIAYRFSKQPKR